MAAGPTIGSTPTSSQPSLPAPYFRIERQVLTFLHYFGPQGVEAVRAEFRLSFNRTEFTLQSLLHDGYIREVEDSQIFVATGRWDPDGDVRKSG